MIPRTLDHSDNTRHRRFSCDELLADNMWVSRNSGPRSEYEDAFADPNGLLGQEPSTVTEQLPTPSSTSGQRAYFIRTLALLCTCSLSVGSHYASYILGPLKSRLAREIGTSHTDFGLLIAAFSLNSTWTPLIGGLLASRLGTTFTSILATGQLLLLVGDICKDVRIMVLGLFIFGLGVSPLAVVQETIIVRFFKSHGLGVSMAFGLIAGKGASFIAARTSYPLTENYGPRAPFYVATFLAGLSVIINLIYIAASKWLIEGAGAELEATDIAAEAQSRLVTSVSEAQALQKVADKRKVKWREVVKLGDIFWAYASSSALLLVVLVPKIVPLKYVSTALGAHKSLEQTGSTIFQTLAGLALDAQKRGNKKNSKAALQHLLNVFVLTNVFQLCSILGLVGLQKRRTRITTRKRSQATNEESDALMGSPNIHTSYASFDGEAGPSSRKMGAYKYIGELYKKKQSDVLRFLLRVRCWEYRQLNVIHRASRPSRPDKARRLGYKAKQGYVIYRVRVRRGNRKKPAPKGATYGKPVRHGVNQLKPQRGLRSVAEERVGRRCGNLRVLNSYWVNQDGVYKYYEVILVDPSHKAIRRDPRINWISNPVHKRREARGLTSVGKQVRFDRYIFFPLPANSEIRTVAWARVIATTMLLLAPPGKNTTPSVSVATVDLAVIIAIREKKKTNGVISSPRVYKLNIEHEAFSLKTLQFNGPSSILPRQSTQADPVPRELPPSIIRRSNLNTNPDGSTYLWLIEDEFSGQTFFDNFTFFTDKDPTNGQVKYVTQEQAFAQGLAYVQDDGVVVMQGDNTTWLDQGVYRNSVRISSYAQYTTGLFILDLNRAPWGCGIWPAFWTVGADNWPQSGEIDIIEGVHDNEHNQKEPYTRLLGCYLTPETNFTGTINQMNGQPNLVCDATVNQNAGCSVLELSRASYGQYFDSTGGGVFAMKWDENGIAVWSFYRATIPKDILEGSPDPSQWGDPSAALEPSGCDPLEYFYNHSIVFGW
ncbi:hypothetical protein H0H93_002936 [Arthromyces matolae]|nr:hypothetical protein H0H93_002936 [Arthromyces matolae]